MLRHAHGQDNLIVFIIFRHIRINFSIMFQSFFPHFSKRIFYSRVNMHFKIFRIFLQFFLQNVQISIGLNLFRENSGLIAGMNHGKVFIAICGEKVLSPCKGQLFMNGPAIKNVLSISEKADGIVHGFHLSSPRFAMAVKMPCTFGLSSIRPI